MEKDTLNEVYSYVERTYLRLQAGDLLNRCLEERTTHPIQQMVEQLILAGPQSLDALREIFAETENRITQINQDQYQLLRDIEKSLVSYGVNLGDPRVDILIRMRRSRFLHFLNQQNIEKTTQLACLQLQKDSRDLLHALNSRLRILEEIKNLIQDWMWGMAVQSAHQVEKKKGSEASLH